MDQQRTPLMDLTTHTEDFSRATVPVAPDAASTVTQPALTTVAGTQCTNCGAELAADQRYCVECGQRCVQSSVPFAESRQVPEARPASRPPRRARVSPNSTLIAGVGTLLLAMGVGVLIGRAGDSTGSNAPAQIVTVGAPAAGGVAATSTPATASPASTGGSKSKSSAAKGASKTAKAGKAPPKAVVKVGTPGKGPGYKNGKFTGQFFGP